MSIECFGAAGLAGTETLTLSVRTTSPPDRTTTRHTPPSIRATSPSVARHTAAGVATTLYDASPLPSTGSTWVERALAGSDGKPQTGNDAVAASAPACVACRRQSPALTSLTEPVSATRHTFVVRDWSATSALPVDVAATFALPAESGTPAGAVSVSLGAIVVTVGSSGVAGLDTCGSRVSSAWHSGVGMPCRRLG